jgi:SAM-dependent methyltransferase
MEKNDDVKIVNLYGDTFRFVDLDANRPFADFCNYHFDKYKENGIMLDIGCGDHKQHPKMIGVDPFAVSDGIDIKADMWDIPLEDNSVDFLVSFASLEHISKFKVAPTLQEWQRILKPGGAFAIIVPNLAYALINWLRNPTVNWDMDMIFGSQEHEGEYHKTGFSIDILVWYFGFTPQLEILNIYDVNAYTQMNFGVIGLKKEE